MDDDQDDIALLRQAMDSVDPSMQMITASNGEEGIKLLKELRKKGNLPKLIVLDINMPRLDGKLTFKQLRADAELAAVPVVIFSTSNNAMDKLFFQHQNVEYITKPVGFDHLVFVAKRLLSYL